MVGLPVVGRPVYQRFATSSSNGLLLVGACSYVEVFICPADFWPVGVLSRQIDIVLTFFRTFCVFVVHVELN